MHPAFAFAPISLPVVIGLLGWRSWWSGARPGSAAPSSIGDVGSGGGGAVVAAISRPFVLVMVTVPIHWWAAGAGVWGGGASSLLLLAASHEVGAWPLDVV